MAGSRRRGNAALHRPQRRTGSGGFSGTGTRRRRPAHRLHVLDLHRHARRPGRTAAGSRRIGHRLHQQPLRRLAQGTDRRRGLRRQHELRAAAFALPGHRAAVRRQRRQRHGTQAPRTGYSLRLYGRVPRTVAAGQGRMARGRSGNRRNARTGRRGVPRNTPPLRQPENPRGESRTKTRRHAAHSLRRLLADGSAFELCRPADRRRRRTIRLYPGHGQSVAPHRHGGGIPAGRNVRLLDQRRLRRIAQGTSGDRPQIHGYAPRAGREGL